MRQRSTLGNIRRSGNTLLILFVAPQKPSRGGIWHPSVMQFYSGPLMHFLSGVDTRFRGFRVTTEIAAIDLRLAALIAPMPLL